MNIEVSRSEFLNYLNWLLLGLRGDHVLTVTNLDNLNDMALFTWKSIFNDYSQTLKIINKIKTMNNVQLVLETHTSKGTLRRRCLYRDGKIENSSLVNSETDNSITEIDLEPFWNER